MAKLVILDMDGLLLDSEKPIRDAWLSETGKLGYPMSELTYLEAVGRSKHDTREIFCRHFGNDFPFDEICSRIEILLEQRAGRSGYELKNGVLELLQYLANRSVPCVVATSTAQLEARTRLHKAKILSYIREVTGGDEVTKGKPHPDLFLLAAKKQGASPGDCLVLEDSEYGARAAHTAGMKVIVIPDLKQPPKDVRELALGIYPSLSESRLAIERWLDVFEITGIET